MITDRSSQSLKSIGLLSLKILFLAHCRLGYEGMFFKRIGEGYQEGAATFYRTSKIQLMNCENTSYAQLANQVCFKIFWIYRLEIFALDNYNL